MTSPPARLPTEQTAAASVVSCRGLAGPIQLGPDSNRSHRSCRACGPSPWRCLGPAIVLLAWLLAGRAILKADEFRVRLPEGGEETIEARLVGSGQGALVLELADGQYRLIPEGAVTDRKIADGPEPLSGDTIAARLTERFGSDVTYTLVKEPFVYVLVVASPLGRTADTRTKNFLQRVATFFKNVDQAFVAFLKETKLKVVSPTHPLPVLIFESQDDFDKYARSITGGNGLSVGRVLGFYSELTNMLAIRLSECRTFETPLHEAIHQLSFNHQMLPRLGSIPRWFAEGLATGFEANQGRVNIGPALVSARYARQVRDASNVSFSAVLGDDASFQGDDLASEAYGRAWGLHWLLVTRHKPQYAAYVKLLGAKLPLQRPTEDERNADFQQAFGKSPEEINRDFRTSIESAIRKQKVQLDPEKPVGVSLTHENMATVEMGAVNKVSEAGSRLEVKGKLTNISPLRSLAFYVTVETETGTYAEWMIPNLEVNKSVPLAPQVVSKVMEGAPGGPSRTFRVHVKSVPAESEEAAAWKQGRVPAPRHDR